MGRGRQIPSRGMADPIRRPCLRVRVTVQTWSQEPRERKGVERTPVWEGSLAL